MALLIIFVIIYLAIAYIVWRKVCGNINDSNIRTILKSGIIAIIFTPSIAVVGHGAIIPVPMLISSYIEPKAIILNAFIFISAWFAIYKSSINLKLKTTKFQNNSNKEKEYNFNKLFNYSNTLSFFTRQEDDEKTIEISKEYDIFHIKYIINKNKIIEKNFSTFVELENYLISNTPFRLSDFNKT